MDYLIFNNFMNYNLNVLLNLREGIEFGVYDGVLSFFEVLQFFFCGLKFLFFWGLEFYDVLQEEIFLVIFILKSEFNVFCRIKFILGF